MYVFRLLAAPLTEQGEWMKREVIIDDVRVPTYRLPSLFPAVTEGSIPDWTSHQAAVRDLFAHHIYGQTPQDPVTLRAEEVTQELVFDGAAHLHQAVLCFASEAGEARLSIAVFLPAQATGRSRVFAGLNFWGNHTVDPLEAIRLSPSGRGMEERARGSHQYRWPLCKLLRAGFAVATAYRGEAVPDNVDHWDEGLVRLWPQLTGAERRPNAMGAVGAWAWALSRMLDYLETLPEVDATQAFAFGHSRLGKAALWAAAQDKRFAGVFANDSGCAGAALSRRSFGETVAHITSGFPYWFAPRFAGYAAREADLPVDQHQLLGLILPRSVHIGSAAADLWADPRGEFLSLREATALLTRQPDQAPFPLEPPAPPGMVHLGPASYHIREGKHDLLGEDWDFFLHSIRKE